MRKINESKCKLELFPLVSANNINGNKHNFKPFISNKKNISNIYIYIYTSIFFILIGIFIKINNNNNFEYKFVYDSYKKNNIDKNIINNLNSNIISIEILIKNNIKAPLYVYYELNNFYQNHKRYVNSYSINQLKGDDLNYNQLKDDCYPLTRLNNENPVLLNPCGLIANSFFNDVINLVSSPINGIYMDENGISLDSDNENKFSQPNSFIYSIVNNTNLYSCNDILGNNKKYQNCKTYYDKKESIYYYYWYPNDENINYLYESYPEIINPIEGVTNEHFIVWFKAAGLNKFRKLYGIINNDLSIGDRLIFDIELNYNITYFNGKKSLILSNLSKFGTKDGTNTLGY